MTLVENDVFRVMFSIVVAYIRPSKTFFDGVTVHDPGNTLLIEYFDALLLVNKKKDNRKYKQSVFKYFTLNNYIVNNLYILNIKYFPPLSLLTPSKIFDTLNPNRRA